MDLDAWLTRLVTPVVSNNGSEGPQSLAQARRELTVFAERIVVRAGLGDVPLRLLECLVRLESSAWLECRGAADLVAVMVALAGGCVGASGHLVLAQKAIEWSRTLSETMRDRFASGDDTPEKMEVDGAEDKQDQDRDQNVSRALCAVFFPFHNSKVYNMLLSTLMSVGFNVSIG